MSTSAARQSPSQTADSRPHRTHSGEGRFVQNFVTFIIMFAVFLVGLYLMSFIDHNNPATWWAMPVAILVASAMYFIGFSRPTRKEHAGR
ncbi:hypothetical protein BKD30_10925 [Tersicoccus phoenicis]|uniref:Uncharacterized protein n=1 Tax=Tersicoccus phoenicis TaxID=554083 RepID=A0A1R1L8K4_9MICC|nr:hypothetical protein [Tersicoccus phoenicis]OMH23870.1 hypothetical protein BKD30_10925 [Tersicoccus phoenicis]